ncbi:MAG: hypothetical protein QNI99_09200 [Woeseiaceae bacterium]|nr:hypothetical protein [Woeseiaceae bacterium]
MSELVEKFAKHWPLLPFVALYGASRLIVHSSLRFLTEEDRALMQEARSALGSFIGLLLLIPVALIFVDLRAAVLTWAAYTLFAITYNFIWCTRAGLSRQYRNRAAIGNTFMLVGIVALGVGYFSP